MEGGRAGKKLLVEDDEEDNNMELAVNTEYASRFEHNMQRARWDRLKSTNPRLAARIEAKASRDTVGTDESEGTESSSDEEEDDGEALLDDQTFLSALSKIRNRDQSIYDSEARLFPDEPSEEGSDEEAPAAKEKPALLKDVLARQALMGEESTSDDDETMGQPSGPTYVEEQEQFRRSFLQEADNLLAEEGDGDDEFGGILKKQRRQSSTAEDLGTSGGAKKAEKTQELLDAYFGKDDQLAEDERFLKHYMLKKGWMDKGDEPLHDGDDDIEEDEEYLQQAERFEARYNHRFEEPGAGNVITYPRNLEGVVRKKDDRRRTAREARVERKAAEAAAMEEEVKRRKAEKRRELDQRLQRIKDASGGAVANKMLIKMLGKEDFDMEEYDRAMAAAFDHSYYEAEDEELAAPEDEAGSDAADEPILDILPEIEDDEDEGEAAEGLPAGLEGERAELARMVEEYQKLDAEDYVGGIPTRFRYREVPAASYGLNILEVLRAPEKDLNQVVGMKKLAPYREDGGLVRPNYSKLRLMQEETEAAAERKKQQSEKGRKGARLVAAAAKQQSRLASFAKPTLAKPDKLKGKKKKETQQPSPAAPDGPQLTKAQRKNLWRQKRRALLKQSLTASL
ncbi:hypothetical protein WJX75_002962 [Coccomyxa subellipsoidea]|uniref:Kri1-like C-terminal domain-containing protein n=1 Tax=Coccomyxa subellipsoidea TaxID=248742 RepID=A0ABR2YQA1_9CHLO